MQRIIDCLDKLDVKYKIKPEKKSTYALVEFWTDTADQDVPTEFDFDGTAEDFVAKFAEIAESYDVDEEVQLYANSLGKNGVPSSISVLFDDCKEAAATLKEIAEKLKKAIDPSSEEDEDKEQALFDICVFGYVFPAIEAENQNEAVQMALDEYHSITGLNAYADDEAVVWKPSYEYPYLWRGLSKEVSA